MNTSLYYLQNETGARWGLTPLDDVFLTNVEGLGLNFDPQHADIGDGFFKLIQKKHPQTVIVGDLKFLPGAFSTYRRLVDFIIQAERLYFVYNPGDNEYYRQITINFLTKAPRDSAGWMLSPISLAPLTPWYLPAVLNLNFETDSDNAMRYDFAYDDKLIYGTGGDDYTAQVTAQGHLPAALRVEFTGAAVNPVFTLRGVASGTVYGTCSVEGEFEATDRLVLSTAYTDSYARKIAADGTETDLLDSLDITTEPFFRVPLSEPCELAITGDSLSGEAAAQAYYYYRSV